MKNLVFVFAILMMSSSGLFAQETSQINVVSLGERKSFWLSGDPSVRFLNYMFQSTEQERGKKYIHRFKWIKVPGINEPLKLKIHEGVVGQETSPEGKCWSSYFNTFTSEKYKKERVARMTENELFGIIVYVEKKGRENISSTEEQNAFMNFILTNS